MKITICTTSIDKFRSLGIRTRDLVELKSIEKNVDASECQDFKNLKFSKKIPNFDLVLVDHMINEEFKYKSLKKLWKKANLFS